MPLRLEPLTAADLPTFREVLGGSEFGGCFCAVWTSYGDDWEARCADATRPNYLVTVGDLGRGRRVGYLVHDGDGVVAWTGSGPKTSFPLLRTKLGSRLSAFSGRIWSVGCVAVRQAHRGRNLAEEIVGAVVERARAENADCVEAYPTRPFDEARAYRGSHRLYERLGFVEVGSERDGQFEILLMRCPLSG